MEKNTHLIIIYILPFKSIYANEAGTPIFHRGNVMNNLVLYTSKPTGIILFNINDFFAIASNRSFAFEYSKSMCFHSYATRKLSMQFINDDIIAIDKYKNINCILFIVLALYLIIMYIRICCSIDFIFFFNVNKIPILENCVCVFFSIYKWVTIYTFE